MARVIGTPGESAASRGLLITVVMGSLLFGLGVPLVIVFFIESFKRGIVGLLFGAVSFAVLYGWRRSTLVEALDLMREGSNFLKGARGEVLVNQALKALPETYIVFNDFHPIDAATGEPSRWNVDHIVVGPTGVFVLDAKYYGKAHVPCARRSSFSARNVKQTQRNAMDLKAQLVRWSNRDLEKLFVVPVVVYAQPDAHLECLREQSVRTLPIRMLLHEIQTHGEESINQEKAGRIALVLFSQIGRDLQYSFRAEMDAYGQLSKMARMAARDERVQRQAAAVEEAPLPPPIPTACPECGGRLLRKVARQGQRAGKPFLGCENYTKNGCRYGFNLEE